MLHLASNNVEEATTIDNDDLIDEAVELLPPQQKKVYILSRRDGMKQQEIAKELNISLETVKKHMVLALRFCKKLSAYTYWPLYIFHARFLQGIKNISKSIISFLYIYEIREIIYMP